MYWHNDFLSTCSDVIFSISLTMWIFNLLHFTIIHRELSRLVVQFLTIFNNWLDFLSSWFFINTFVQFIITRKIFHFPLHLRFIHHPFALQCHGYLTSWCNPYHCQRPCSFLHLVNDKWFDFTFEGQNHLSYLCNAWYGILDSHTKLMIF